MSGLIPNGDETWAEWVANLDLDDDGGGSPGGEGPVISVNERDGEVTLTKADVGLDNVNNTSDATKNTTAATLTNKTLTAPVVNAPTGITKSDVGLGNVDNTSNATERAASATLTNKTLASPAISGTPTGITATHVGLGNVSNTSDATERAATATLTNKTLTSPVINSPTGLAKADVGLGSVDNTSDSTKNAATATLTNKTLASPVISGTPTGITATHVGLGNVSNTSDATKNAATATLTNKTLDSPTFTGTVTGLAADDFGLSEAEDLPFTPDAPITASNVHDAIIEAASLPVASGGGGIDIATLVRLSTLAGATDSAKLATFCTTYGGVTQKPTLLLDEAKDYNWTLQQTLPQGFAMIGGGFRALDQARTGGGTVVPQKHRIRCTSGTGWLRFANGNTFGIYIAGLSMDATAAVANRMFQPNASAVPWTIQLRDLSYQNGPGIMGSPAIKQPVDVLVTSGFWNINNITDATNGTAWNIGGSDNTLGGDKMLIDTQTSLMAASGALVRLSGLSKTEVHGLYLTAEEHRAMVISGTNWMLHLHHNYIEGRHADQPSLGALLQISSDVTISDSWFAYAMSSPSDASGGESGNRGVLHQSGGVCIYSNLTYAPADGVANTVPIIYVTGSTTRAFISNIVGKTDAGTYFKPVVRVLSGATVVADSSVTIVNV